MIVIDASIAAKWFLPESSSEAAVNLLSSKKKLLAPAILRHEVTAAIAKAARMNRISKEDAHLFIGRWCRMLENHVVSLIPAETVFMESVQLCLDLSHPLYDCFYLSTAQKFEALLATTDKRLIEQAQKINIGWDALLPTPVQTSLN